jgi:hypothetical protein
MKKLLIYKDGKKSKWLDEYNRIIQASINNPRKVKEENGVKYSLHHIFPRSYFPDKKDLEENKCYIDFHKHIYLHYLLWKHNGPKYCSQFWFCYVWYRKNYKDLLTSKEYTRLKQDLSLYRKEKTNERRKEFRKRK